MYGLSLGETDDDEDSGKPYTGIYKSLDSVSGSFCDED